MNRKLTFLFTVSGVLSVMNKKMGLIVTAAVLGVLIWAGTTYGQRWVAVAQTQVCVPDAASDGALGAMAKVLCKPERVVANAAAWGSDEQRVVLTVTTLPSVTPNPAQAKSTAVPQPTKKITRKGTPLPSATPFPATGTPGPPVPLPTPTKPRNDGSGGIGNSSMPCALEKGAGGGMSIQCKKIVP